MRLSVLNLVLVPLIALGLLLIAATHDGRALLVTGVALAVVYSVAVSFVANGSRYQVATRILAGLAAIIFLVWLFGLLIASQI